jgi:hypothetical protein
VRAVEVLKESEQAKRNINVTTTAIKFRQISYLHSRQQAEEQEVQRSRERNNASTNVVAEENNRQEIEGEVVMAKATASNAMNSLRTNLWHKRPAAEVAEATSHLEATRVHLMELEANRTYLENEDLDLTYLQAEIADILSEALEYIKVNTPSPIPTTLDYVQAAANQTRPGSSGIQQPVVPQPGSQQQMIPPRAADLTMHQAFDLNTTSLDLNQTDTSSPGPQAPVISDHDLTIRQCMAAPVVTSMQRGFTQDSIYTPRRDPYTGGAPPPALPTGLPPGLPTPALPTNLPPRLPTPAVAVLTPGLPNPMGTTVTSITIPTPHQSASRAFNSSWGQPPPMPPAHNQSWGQGADVNTSWAPMHNSTGLNQSQVHNNPGGAEGTHNNPGGPPSWQPPIRPPMNPLGQNNAQRPPYTNNAYQNHMYGGNGSRYGSNSPGFGEPWQRERAPMKLAPIQLATFSREDISTYFAFKQDFIAYIHMREGMKVEEKMARLLSLTLGGPAHDLIFNLTRDEAGYYEALEQLDADFGNQDRQFAVALGGLTSLPQIDLAQPSTVRAARIAIRKVISHLKQIPGTNVASHASTALLALQFTPEARFALNLFQTSQRAETLTFELFEQWSQSQLLMTHNDPLARSTTPARVATTPAKLSLPYTPKLPSKTVSVAATLNDDSSGDGCSDLEQTMM